MAAQGGAAKPGTLALPSSACARRTARRRTDSRQVICINHSEAGSSGSREFCFAAERGLLQCMRDLSDSFGYFDAETGGYKRSILHPSGYVCTLVEHAESANDDGSDILWGGALAAALMLTGAARFAQVPAPPANAPYTMPTERGVRADSPASGVLQAVQDQWDRKHGQPIKVHSLQTQ